MGEISITINELEIHAKSFSNHTQIKCAVEVYPIPCHSTIAARASGRARRCSGEHERRTDILASVECVLVSRPLTKVSVDDDNLL